MLPQLALLFSLPSVAATVIKVSGGGYMYPYYEFSDNFVPEQTMFQPGSTYTFESDGIDSDHSFSIGTQSPAGKVLPATFNPTAQGTFEGRLYIQGSQQSLTFTVPADYRGPLYYFCWEHPDEMYNPIGLLAPPASPPSPQLPPLAPPPLQPTPKSSSSEPCFPSDAVVETAKGERMRIADVQEGDRIRAATFEGELVTDVVTLLSIAKPEAMHAAFIRLHMHMSSAANHSFHNLTLTPDHHLPVGDRCCSTLVTAKEVRVGQTVWVAPPHAPIARAVVSAITTRRATGLHSPVLVGGSLPIVDGVVTAFDSMDRLWLAKHGLAPLLAACKATGTCGSLKRALQGPA